ncbi:MAG: copper oxidase [Synechococcus sp. TMED20]|nr:MAG: copper oxidase [Synechococcus sp. TMED20]
MKSLKMLGYGGPGFKNYATNDDYWNTDGASTDDDLLTAINILSNYDPESVWAKYNPEAPNANVINSDFDADALLQNVNGEDNPNLWYPSLLYTYGVKGEGPSYPGPVLMVEPGDQVRLNFSNDIRIADLDDEQTDKATLVQNSTPGNTASDGLGGTTSTNFHLHGSHTNPSGFGDNVVSRFTTGQDWTTIIDLPADHGQGSYWYHPHYHPSVNQQVYGGLTGFMQIGDPLSNIPAFKDVPRNLALLKTMDLGVNSETGDLLLAGFDGYGGPFLGNSMTMVTVNGEFQPEAEVKEGGWQSLTLNNQTQQAFYNVTLIHTDDDGNKTTLPIYAYGEDGHQYPQIRQAIGALNSSVPTEEDGVTCNIEGAPDPCYETLYETHENVVTMAPGKRMDLMVYLPEGTTEVATKYFFTNSDGNIGITDNMGGYPELTSETVDNGLGATGGQSAGPMATFKVKNGTALPSQKKLDKQIEEANAGIQIQKIKPSTKPEDYEDGQVPSVNLFQKKKGEYKWKPLRHRRFNYSKETLVGPEDEWDIPTQQLVGEYNAENPDDPYERYEATTVFTEDGERYFGYEKPFLINDHVFPNGNLTIAQLGTMEEWVNRNWSVAFGSSNKYIGHPFHIHINDYQVKNSDTELLNKRSLEDVTMLNSSGYKYYDTSIDKLIELEPYQGSLHTIKEAMDPDTVGDLNTHGANDQTVRMLFQDYLGTYVYHCHILPHEDAGMMQVITVVENTDSSWLAPAERDNYLTQDGTITLRLAQDFSTYSLTPENDSAPVTRMVAGDITNDFTQDIVLSKPSAATETSGQVELYDGAALLDNTTELLSSLTPYDSILAPYAFAEDFDGDGSRDLVTAGFEGASSSDVNLKKLTINAWSGSDDSSTWSEEYSFRPFKDIDVMAHGDGVHGHPVDNLQDDQVSVAMADMNLDNFQDVAISYAIEGGIRVLVLDGAAMSLQHQTGSFEGGYFPDENVLADALILDSSLNDLSEIVLTAGFSSYAQSALEDLLITTKSTGDKRKHVFTTQLQAGHFIATSEPSSDEDSDSSHAGHGATVATEYDDSVVNLRNNSMPLSISDKQHYSKENGKAPTPTIAGVFGNGAMLVDKHLVISQGATQGDYSYGNTSSSNNVFNTSQELTFNLHKINSVTKQKNKGVLGESLDTTFKGKQVTARANTVTLLYQAYANTTADPAHSATAAGYALGEGVDIEDLAYDLQGAHAEPIIDSYGGSLDELSVKDIVTGAFNNLYGRDPSKSEINEWKDAVSGGLDQTLLPAQILLDTDGDDIYRTALMSATNQWNQAQWGTAANLLGSFGQGLKSSEKRFDSITEPLADIGVLSSWEEAQEEFDDYTASALKELVGTPISKSGFF